MSENKHDNLEGSAWEVRLQADNTGDKATRRLNASFIVRLSAQDGTRVEDAAQDRVHGYLYSQPHTYRGFGAEVGPKTIRDLYGIPEDYALTVSECESPTAGILDPSCHEPVELHELQWINLAPQDS